MYIIHEYAHPRRASCNLPDILRLLLCQQYAVLWLYVYTYIYAYMYTCICIYIYIYIYTQT